MSKKNYLPFILLGALILSAWAVYGGNQKNSPPKLSWEYKYFSLYRSIDGNGKWEKMWEDGKSVGETLPTIFQKFKELGEQGWELTSTVTLSDARHEGYEGYNNDGVLLKTTPSYAGYTNEVYYYFKRSK